MAESQGQLPYADLPARWGVSLERSDRTLRIVTPPLSLRCLPFGIKVAFGILAVPILATIFPIVFRGQRWNAGMMIPLGLFGAILICLLGCAWQMLRYFTVIEVGPSHLSIFHHAGGRPRLYRQWLRSEIGAVKANPYDGNLQIQVTGITLEEIQISGGPEVSEWMAWQIQEALQSLPVIPAATPVET